MLKCNSRWCKSDPSNRVALEGVRRFIEGCLFLQYNFSELVKFLKAKQEDEDEEKPLITRYNLADMVFAKAEISKSGVVHLWLGANVMLEYTYDEAIELLSSKLEKAQKDMLEISENLSFVRNQIITSEVNISRIYNWDVRKKRQERLEAQENK